MSKGGSLGGDVQTLTLAGQWFVVLPESEYLRLRPQADRAEAGPPLPEPDAQGNYPAVEALRVTLARKIIRRRRAAGLAQVELASRAGIRPETLNRLEQGRHTPSIPTVDKLDRALAQAESKETAQPQTGRTARKAKR